MKTFLKIYKSAVQHMDNRSFDCYEDYIVAIREEVEIGLEYVSLEHYNANQVSAIACIESVLPTNHKTQPDECDDLPF